MVRRVGNSLPTRRIWPLLAIAFTLAVLTWAGFRVNAAWHFFAARSYVSNMIETGDVTQVLIDNANHRIALALRRFPRQPDYLDLAGRIQHLQASRPGVVGKIRRKSLETAADYYREALSVRPLWPYSWANLLGVKDALGEIDDEFKLALERSIQTGPWEHRVRNQVLTSGLRHWDKLAVRERDMVQNKIMDGLQAQPGKVFEIVRSFGRPDLICDDGSDYRQILQWCKTVLPHD